MSCVISHESVDTPLRYAILKKKEINFDFLYLKISVCVSIIHVYFALLLIDMVMSMVL